MSENLPSVLVKTVLLAALFLASGCMGEPTREILLPVKLKGARVTADGEEATDPRQGITSRIPLRSGNQVVRVEMPGVAPLVQRTRVFVNDPKAERSGENVIVAAVDQKMMSRTIISFPEDPINNLGHDFQPPVSGEGVVLLASQPSTRVSVDGGSWEADLANKAGKLYESYVTHATVVKLEPGKHRAEFSKRGYLPCEVEFEVHPGEYEVIGATLVKETAEGSKP